MPTYEYECRSCKKVFTKVQTLKEAESGKVACPHCGKEDLRRLLSVVSVKTRRKS